MKRVSDRTLVRRGHWISFAGSLRFLSHFTAPLFEKLCAPVKGVWALAFGLTPTVVRGGRDNPPERANPVLYYLRKSCRGAQISWSSFPRSSSGNPCRPGNPAAPPGCPLGNCGHDEMQIWSLGCGRRPALSHIEGGEWPPAGGPAALCWWPCRPLVAAARIRLECAL